MPRILHSTHTFELFTYKGRGTRDVRERPVIALALLHGSQTKSYSDARSGRNIMKLSLATLGSGRITDDDRKNDFYLPLYDHGHLLGAQYGGSDESCNLVPMLRGANRGGDWAGFERTVTRLTQPSIVALRCTYARNGDPRIPVRIEAALVPIDKEGAAKVAGDWRFWRRILVDAAEDAPSERLDAYLAGQLGMELHVDAGKVRGEIIRQEPFVCVLPFLEISNRVLFFEKFRQAQYRVAEGWCVEKDPLARRTQARPDPDTIPEDLQFKARYRLPPLNRRPYAALDYMALHGQLTDRLIGGRNRNHDITNKSILTGTRFNDEMRSFAMYVNIHVNRYTMTNQAAYLSDAYRDADHPDPGTAGDGIVLDPEFDHIIPRHPGDGLPDGPTMFSNLQIVSPVYNTSKSNRIVAGRDDVLVGKLEPAARDNMRPLQKRGPGQAIHAGGTAGQVQKKVHQNPVLP